MGTARKPKSKSTRAPRARLSKRSESPAHSPEVHELRNIRNRLDIACDTAYVAAALCRPAFGNSSRQPLLHFILEPADSSGANLDPLRKALFRLKFVNE